MMVVSSIYEFESITYYIIYWYDTSLIMKVDFSDLSNLGERFANNNTIVVTVLNICSQNNSQETLQCAIVRWWNMF